jgi:hypothetical protein
MQAQIMAMDSSAKDQREPGWSSPVSCLASSPHSIFRQKWTYTITISLPNSTQTNSSQENYKGDKKGKEGKERHTVSSVLLANALRYLNRIILVRHAKLPNRNMRMRIIFFRVIIVRCSTSGKGRRRINTSDVMPMPALEKASAFRERQCEGMEGLNIPAVCGVKRLVWGGGRTNGYTL